MRPTDQLPAPLPSADPGGHLPVALLRQYVAGTLAPAAQHRVEAHTLDCQRCAEVLEGLEMTDAATTDHSLTDLQGRLQARVAPAAGRKPAAGATRAWLQMVGALLVLIASIVGWRLNQAKTEAQSEPVAAVMSKKESAAAPREATVLAAPQPESEAMKSQSAPAESAAADAAESEVERPAPARVAASARTRAAKNTRPVLLAEPASVDIAAIRPDAVDTKDKVVLNSVSAATVAAAETPAAVVASAPLPPDRARTALARPAATTTSDSGKQIGKMPPSGNMRSLADREELTAAAGMNLVRGRITDQRSGAGLPGVTVLIKGTQHGVSTQADGSFALPVTDSQSTLTIASIGYQSREYRLTNPSAPLTLALSPDTRALSEVVVTRKGKMPAPPAIGPAPAGGLPAFHEYLKKALEYPKKALNERTQGTVKLKFMVTATGAIEDLKVVNSLSKECDEEAMRLVREGPAWFPGIIGGRRTAQQVRITVPFRL